MPVTMPPALGSMHSIRASAQRQSPFDGLLGRISPEGGGLSDLPVVDPALSSSRQNHFSGQLGSIKRIDKT
jgi:hypothetical protein